VFGRNASCVTTPTSSIAHAVKNVHAPANSRRILITPTVTIVHMLTTASTATIQEETL